MAVMINFCNYCKYGQNYLVDHRTHCASCFEAYNDFPSEFKLKDDLKELMRMLKEGGRDDK